ncbi:hypothetical protein [Moorena sp. SIO2C4]|nr:hypothetical protein [Moorena sp. SIO2C4]
MATLREQQSALLLIRKQSAISNQQSAIINQQSAISYQLSALFITMR